MRCRLLALAALSVLLGACSVEGYRHLLSGYQPAPASRKIDLPVAIETRVVDARFADANYEEALRQVITEDVAALFSRELLRKGSGEQYLLQLSARYDAGATLFSTASLDVTAVVMDAGTGATLSSHHRTADRVGHEPVSLLRSVMGDLKKELVKTFDGLAVMPPRGLQLQPLPGRQSDR
ncbi:MAG: hypothetical protein ACREP8_03470 [Candidatus Binatia bacterium]